MKALTISAILITSTFLSIVLYYDHVQVTQRKQRKRIAAKLLQIENSIRPSQLQTLNETKIMALLEECDQLPSATMDEALKVRRKRLIEHLMSI